MYGAQVGKKFAPDGKALRYPGNTVIADIRPGCAAYDTITRLKDMAFGAGLEQCLILLPEDSYHMTVIRGLNDCVRSDGYWPGTLEKSLPFSEADDYVEAAIGRAGLPGEIRMRFTGVRMNEEDFRVLAEPADEEQAQALRMFRDRAADQLRLRLPGHDAYAYHITLAYTLFVPQGELLDDAKRAVADMEDVLKESPAFVTTPPYVAFYDSMLSFHARRIPRLSQKGEQTR